MERFNGEKVYVVYFIFFVGNEVSKYILQVNEYVGMVGEYCIKMVIGKILINFDDGC